MSETLDRRQFLTLAAVGAGSLAFPAAAQAAEAQPVALPAPRMTGGKPLMEALAARRTTRTFGPQPIPLELLSSLLWAAWGYNRPGDGRRTAPSAHNAQELDIYPVNAQGAWRYDAKANQLIPVAAGDLRAATGTQAPAAAAALNLVYVADLERMRYANQEDRLIYSAANTGFIAQNVYLFCASEGLATVVRAGVDRPALAQIMGLKESQRIVLVQSVGYPAG